MDFDLIRHFASVERGRRIFEPPPVELDSMAVVQMQKAATADSELLELAAWVAPDGDSMAMYKTLGGGFDKEADIKSYELLKSRMKQASVKLALGAPMFQAPQVGLPGAPGPATASLGMKTPSLKPPTPGVSMPGMSAPKPQTPQLGQGAGTVPQGQQPTQTPKIKVQLQPQQGAQQGTSVSVG